MACLCTCGFALACDELIPMRTCSHCCSLLCFWAPRASPHSVPTSPIVVLIVGGQVPLVKLHTPSVTSPTLSLSSHAHTQGRTLVQAAELQRPSSFGGHCKPCIGGVYKLGHSPFRLVGALPWPRGERRTLVSKQQRPSRPRTCPSPLPSHPYPSSPPPNPDTVRLLGRIVVVLLLTC
jgi:hypothetical protein